MLKCAVLDDYQNVARNFADWSALEGRAEVTFLHHHLGEGQAVSEALKDYDVLVVMRERTRFDAAVLNALPRLKLLVTTGPVNAAIDLEAARAAGITVCGTGGDRRSTAELTWALILGAARGLTAEAAAVRDGGWQQGVGMALYRRRLGVMGLGHIGAQVAAVGRAFGMEVLTWSPNMTAERAEAAGATFVEDREAFFAQSDIVSLHLALVPATRGIVGRSELRAMKPEALLINTARAELVDEAALREALEARWFAGAGLDVFHREPLEPGDSLRSLPHVLATPHIGYVADRVYRIYYRDALEDILAWMDGTPLRQL